MAVNSKRKAASSKTSSKGSPATKKKTGKKKSFYAKLKPNKDFPLTAHPSGQWMKKIRGKIYYFGRWGRRVDGKMERLPDDGCKEALKALQCEYPYLSEGLTPPNRDDTQEQMTLGRLCSSFLQAKLKRLGISEDDFGKLAGMENKDWSTYLIEKAGQGSHKISPRMCLEYKNTADRLVNKFGKDRAVESLGPKEFAKLWVDLDKQYGPHRLGNEIQKVRSIFLFAFENGLTEKKTVFGSEFDKPSKSEMRKHRASNGSRMIEADELRKLLSSAPVPLKAMILLGLNCGFGNHDCAMLPKSKIDLEKGWVDFPRPKTGIERRCPLWPETVVALREAIEERPEPREEKAKELVFVTTRGRQWLSRGIANPVSVACRKLMKEVKVHREGLGFYSLRHIFRTIADGCLDQVAINFIMGHADNSMASVYRERIDDKRLQAVVDHVHQWLFVDGEGE